MARERYPVKSREDEQPGARASEKTTLPHFGDFDRPFDEAVSLGLRLVAILGAGGSPTSSRWQKVRWERPPRLARASERFHRLPGSTREQNDAGRV